MATLSVALVCLISYVWYSRDGSFLEENKVQDLKRVKLVAISKYSQNFACFRSYRRRPYPRTSSPCSWARSCVSTTCAPWSSPARRWRFWCATPRISPRRISSCACGAYALSSKPVLTEVRQLGCCRCVWEVFGWSAIAADQQGLAKIGFNTGFKFLHGLWISYFPAELENFQLFQIRLVLKL